VDLNLAGRTAVVTGAGRGIGLAITRALVSEGVHVIAGNRTRTAELDEMEQARQIDVVEVDLAHPEGPRRLVDAGGAQLDILVNNVGAARPRLEGFLAVTDEMWSETLNLDLMAAVRAMRTAIPIMLEAGGGAIVNIGSINARLPDPTVIDYSAAKAAFVNVAKSLSKEFGPRGIRVNTIDPGPVATDLWLGADGVAARLSAASGRTAEEVAAAAATGMVTGRFTRAEEVANLVLVLASDRTANVTGADFVIDGGMVTTV
jgi:NAD(P)-dependent dehydrogenase (short-subunit alcohol dehydrogenase family)